MSCNVGYVNIIPDLCSGLTLEDQFKKYKIPEKNRSRNQDEAHRKITVAYKIKAMLEEYNSKNYKTWTPFAYIERKTLIKRATVRIVYDLLLENGYGEAS